MKHLAAVGKDRPVLLLCGSLGIASVIIISFFGYENKTSLFTVLKLSILSVVLLSVLIFYIISQQGKLMVQPYFCRIFSLLYIGSLITIFLTKNNPEITVWMAGGLLTSMLFDMYLGFMVTFHFVFFAAFAGGYQLELIIYLFILGNLLCLLSGYMKKYNTLGYTAVIVLSMQIILLFIINNFILKKALNLGAVFSLAGSLITILVSFGIYSLYLAITAKDWEAVTLDGRIDGCKIIPESGKDIPAGKEAVRPYDKSSGEGKGWNLEEVLDIDFPLLIRLKEYSEKVYKHSLLIGDLSQKAAKAIGADENLAKAGGFYHEIGRIVNKEYVEEGVKLAQQYYLPEVITQMIRQHNLKYEKPKSPEAAIVMITISIIATKEYLEKCERKSLSHSSTGKMQNHTVPIEKIVDNVFQMRLTKGSLDESGLTLKQYNDLKEFFVHIGEKTI